MSQTASTPSDLVRGKEAYETLEELKSQREVYHVPPSIYRDNIWKKTDGTGIKVAILDSGYTPHPSLKEPLHANTYVSGESYRDGNGHGCHCAGTAIGDDGIGFAPGADWGSFKCLSNRGSGGYAGIAAAFKDAMELGYDIISMSIGGGGFYKPLEDLQIEAANRGVMVVCAAGNSSFNGSSNTITWPGRSLWNCTVTAIDKNGNFTRFSSGGRQADVAFYGQDIISCSHRGSGYVSMSGTSMATPGIAGVFALVEQERRQNSFPRTSGVEGMRELLANFSTDAGDEGKDDRFGYGIASGVKMVESLATDQIKGLGVG